MNFQTINGQKVYNSLADAKQAHTEFQNKVAALQDEFGIRVQYDDDCAEVYDTVKYLSKQGVICTYWG